MEGYISIREASCKWDVSERRIDQYCAEERIPGATKIGNIWPYLPTRKSPATLERRKQSPRRRKPILRSLRV